MRSQLRRLAAAATVLLTAGAAACGVAVQGGTPGTGTGHRGFAIGLLFPPTYNARLAHLDRPWMERRIRQLCPECQVQAASASEGVASQQQQMESMIAKGFRVLVLNPVDYEALRPSIVRAQQAHIPVISYDRLAQGPIAAYSGFDSVEIGRLQARALLTALGGKVPGARIVMMNGDTGDPNTGDLVRGALSVLRGKVRIGPSYYTTGWLPQNAFANMSAAMAQLGRDGIDGVYAGSDGIASAVIHALKSDRVRPIPPVTGQDADLNAVRRVVAGDQYVTIYKPITEEAEAAAEMAVALGRGERLDAIANATVGNDTRKDIPAVLGPLYPVTVHTVRQTVVRDGLYTVDQICTPQLRSACRAAGLIG